MGLFMPGNMPTNPYPLFLSAEFTDYSADSKRGTMQVNVGDTFHVAYTQDPYVITGFVFLNSKLHTT